MRSGRDRPLGTLGSSAGRVKAIQSFKAAPRPLTRKQPPHPHTDRPIHAVHPEGSVLWGTSPIWKQLVLTCASSPPPTLGPSQVQVAHRCLQMGCKVPRGWPPQASYGMGARVGGRCPAEGT